MRSSLKVQKALMVPHCISPPLFFVFVFIFWGCFFFFAWENVASEIFCSELHKNSGGKQYNNHFKMLDDTVVSTATSQQEGCGFTFDPRPFCVEFACCPCC